MDSPAGSFPDTSVLGPYFLEFALQQSLLPMVDRAVGYVEPIKDVENMFYFVAGDLKVRGTEICNLYVSFLADRILV